MYNSVLVWSAADPGRGVRGPQGPGAAASSRSTFWGIRTPRDSSEHTGMLVFAYRTDLELSVELGSDAGSQGNRIMRVSTTSLDLSVDLFLAEMAIGR